MSGFTRRLRKPVAWLCFRFRLPFTRRTLPIWVVIGMTAGLLVPGTGAAIVYTNQPVFCNSCHEMGLHYVTWRQSAHREVNCESCHIMPGYVNMFRSKLGALRLVKEHVSREVHTKAIQGHVPDTNCKTCHRETAEVVAYHGLKITHRAHWKMGVSCTYCHDRVVHGPKWLYTGVSSTEQVAAVGTPYKFTPSMEGCYGCHDGKRASNQCSTCHVTLGERRPTAFDPAWAQAHRHEVQHRGEQDCQRCHSATFCQNCHHAANPHRSQWIGDHAQEAEKNPKSCPSCHLAPAEPRARKVKEMAFCRACHGLRLEHRQADWQVIHGRESLADPSACQRCHTSSWCSDCHAISRPHPQEWLARHPAEATRNPTNCRTCHEQQFCEACHRGRKGVPSSHTIDWLTRHKEVAQARRESCRVCHRTGFCQSCHAEKAPASHGSRWLKQHGAANQAQPASCLLCHPEADCNRCHGVEMPHPKLWLAAHHKGAKTEPALCERCHRKQACDACHRGAFPASHQPPDWLGRHGKEASKQGANCALCHRPQSCTACHGLPMPHPTGWKGEAHSAAANRDDASCLRCHRQDYCNKCHRLQMPHPDTWMAEHGRQATLAAGICGNCHGANRHDCNLCHLGLAPASHGEQNWVTQHGPLGAGTMPLCGLCHGENACAECHAKRAAAEGGKQ